MAKKKKKLIKMKCSECGNINYWTRKNCKTIQKKLAFSKFCASCRKHIVHKETR